MIEILCAIIAFGILVLFVKIFGDEEED